LLYSQHEDDLDQLIRQQIGNVRKEVWGRPDLTGNPFLSLWSQVSVLYNIEPEIMPPSGSEGVVDAVADAGYWPLMQRVQRDTLALREMLVRVDVIDGVLTFRPVFPDYVEASADPARPGVPVMIAEWMHHDSCGWVRHVLDVRDPERPQRRRGDLAGAWPRVFGAVARRLPRRHRRAGAPLRHLPRRGDRVPV
jgi:hypothetical protein